MTSITRTMTEAPPQKPVGVAIQYPPTPDYNYVDIARFLAEASFLSLMLDFAGDCQGIFGRSWGCRSAGFGTFIIWHSEFMARGVPGSTS